MYATKSAPPPPLPPSTVTAHIVSPNAPGGTTSIGYENGTQNINGNNELNNQPQYIIHPSQLDSRLSSIPSTSISLPTVPAASAAAAVLAASSPTTSSLTNNQQVLFWSSTPQGTSPFKVSSVPTTSVVTPVTSVGVGMPTFLSRTSINQHDLQLPTHAHEQLLARPNPSVSNCGLVIVQVDQQGHPHQQHSIRPLHRQHHTPENRATCSNNALLTPQGVNIPVNENIVQQQSLLQIQQQRGIAEKENSERHQHSRQDVWTFPEGSSVMAQNGVPLITSNQLNQANASQATLPIAMNASANKVKVNGILVSDNANESDGEESSSADEGYRTTSSSSGCSESSPPHHESDPSRTPPFPIGGARKNISFGNPTAGTSSNGNIHSVISTPSLHESASTSNQSHQFVPIQSLSTTPISTATPITGRFPSSSMVPGRTQVLGETGVVLQGSGALMGASGAYPYSSVPSQFGQGTGVAVNSGEEGNNNLMWLLDFKLDFFNDQEAERNLALQAPLFHASNSGIPITQGQYINTLSQNRNESINALSSSNHTTSTTTLTPLVNAKIHPQSQLSHEQINPSQYTIATIQQPSAIQSNNQHVQYPHALQAVLHQQPQPLVSQPPPTGMESSSDVIIQNLVVPSTILTSGNPNDPINLNLQSQEVPGVATRPSTTGMISETRTQSGLVNTANCITSCQNLTKPTHANSQVFEESVSSIEQTNAKVSDDDKSSSRKPPYTYTELITQALKDKEKLTVSGIYNWITDRFHYFKAEDDRWKNSVRHNLSMNPHFRKGGKAKQGSGHLWVLADYDKEDQFSHLQTQSIPHNENRVAPQNENQVNHINPNTSLNVTERTEPNTTDSIKLYGQQDRFFKNTIAATTDKEDDEASRAVKSIILDKNESEILERITRTTQEVKPNKSTIDPNRINSSQISRKRDIHSLNAEQVSKMSQNNKVSDHLIPLQTQRLGQDMSATQHQQPINNVAVDVEVHYTENNINNNTDQTIALDMAKVTAGAPDVFVTTDINNSECLPPPSSTDLPTPSGAKRLLLHMQEGGIQENVCSETTNTQIAHQTTTVFNPIEQIEELSVEYYTNGGGNIDGQKLYPKPMGGTRVEV